VYDSPAEMVFWVPSVSLTNSRPDRQWPTCETWHDSVLATGFTHSDQRQPGSRAMRPKVTPSRPTTSTRVLFGVRTSSGESWDLTSTRDTETGFDMIVSFCLWDFDVGLPSASNVRQQPFPCGQSDGSPAPTPAEPFGHGRSRWLSIRIGMRAVPRLSARPSKLLSCTDVR
jgi:hypothetical protein